MKMFDTVAQKLKDSKKIVFVTGAGISQESGILFISYNSK